MTTTWTPMPSGSGPEATQAWTRPMGWAHLDVWLDTRWRARLRLGGSVTARTTLGGPGWIRTAVRAMAMAEGWAREVM